MDPYAAFTVFRACSNRFEICINATLNPRIGRLELSTCQEKLEDELELLGAYASSAGLLSVSNSFPTSKRSMGFSDMAL